MVILEKNIKKAKEMLDNSVRPLIFFDDDCDGLTSFLMMYNYMGEGKGSIVKAAPYINETHVEKVRKYQPDLVVILDIANVNDDFFDKVTIPVLWLDHHQYNDIKRNNVHYVNPKEDGSSDNQPTAYWAYKILNEDKYLWLATLGCISDWYKPEFLEEFMEKYPDMLSEDKVVDDILYDSNLGYLYQAVLFSLKGPRNDVKKIINIMTRIKAPCEIIGDKKTPQGNFIYKRYLKYKEEYDLLLGAAKSQVKEDFVIFNYPSGKTSFTSELSNELMHLYPDKVIIIARRKNGEVKMSLRSAHIDLPKAIEYAINHGCLNGYGGGHARASGACIQEDQFETFVEKIKEYKDSHN